MYTEKIELQSGAAQSQKRPEVTKQLRHNKHTKSHTKTHHVQVRQAKDKEGILKADRGRKEDT